MQSSRRASRAIVWTLAATECGLAVSAGYLFVLLLAAGDAKRRFVAGPEAENEGDLRFLVLIPAHDEEAGLSATLTSLASCRHSSAKARVVVVADNCSDGTARMAREGGAEVWERSDPVRCGKGFALTWALEQIREDRIEWDAVLVLDADCLVAPNLIEAVATRVRCGARAVQAKYAVDNPQESTASALRFAGFALMNTVRPAGKQRLGLSCGLFGTGMAFTKDLLDREPWTASGLAEDSEYHMQLVNSGNVVEFAPETWVSSSMPVSLRDNGDQHARWEKGKLDLIRRWSPRLVASGIAKRDMVRLHAGLEPLAPPQSLMMAGSTGAMVAAWRSGSTRLLVLACTTLLAQLSFIAGGLRLVDAPAEVYRSFAGAPMLIANKVLLYVRLLSGRGPKAWIRTHRQ